MTASASCQHFVPAAPEALCLWLCRLHAWVQGLTQAANLATAAPSGGQSADLDAEGKHLPPQSDAVPSPSGPAAGAGAAPEPTALDCLATEMRRMAAACISSCRHIAEAHASSDNFSRATSPSTFSRRLQVVFRSGSCGHSGEGGAVRSGTHTHVRCRCCPGQGSCSGQPPRLQQHRPAEQPQAAARPRRHPRARP